MEKICKCTESCPPNLSDVRIITNNHHDDDDDGGGNDDDDQDDQNMRPGKNLSS